MAWVLFRQSRPIEARRRQTQNQQNHQPVSSLCHDPLDYAFTPLLSSVRPLRPSHVGFVVHMAKEQLDYMPLTRLPPKSSFCIIMVKLCLTGACDDTVTANHR